MQKKKFEASFEFTPSHSLVLYTNYKPEISANDKGTWRRIIVIPFKAQIDSKQDIKNYSDYLFKMQEVQFLNGLSKVRIRS